jgi:hypothetical protein
MSNGRRVGSLMAALAAVALGGAAARADLVIVMNDPYTPAGVQPAGSPPWGTATFKDLGGNKVELTMALNLQGASEFVSNWYFNFDETLAIGMLSAAYVSGQAAQSVNVGPFNAYNVPGSGRADIRFGFTTANNANRFTGTETSVYTFTYFGAGTFNADSFKFLFQPKGENPVFLSAMHVQGLSGGGSVHVGGHEYVPPPPPHTVPEPSSIVLAGLGGVALIGLARRRQARR